MGLAYEDLLNWFAQESAIKRLNDVEDSQAAPSQECLACCFTESDVPGRGCRLMGYGNGHGCYLLGGRDVGMYVFGSGASRDHRTVLRFSRSGGKATAPATDESKTLGMM